jgi:membrane-bound serine protease (ClpP class)
MDTSTHWNRPPKRDHRFDTLNPPRHPEKEANDLMSMLGVILVLAGAALMVAEAHLPTHGALGAGAATALTAGVVLALSGAGAAAGTVVAAGVTVALVGLAVVWLLVVKSVAAHRLAVRSGPPALTGRVATVRTVPAPIGQVALDGALWRARMWDLENEGAPVAEGSAVVIESIDGLTLTVRPAEEWEVH